MSVKNYPPQLVRDLMTVGVPTCSEQTLATELARRMLDKDWEAVCVLDEEGHAVGVVSREDLVAAYAFDRISEATTAAAIMDEQVIELPADIPVRVAAQMMRDQKTRAVFLMHNANGIIYPAAMLTYTHFLRHLVTQSQDDLKDLGIRTLPESPVEAFMRRRDAARRQTDS